MAEFNLPFGVRIANNDPVDFDRYIAADLTARAAIVSEGRAYEGLQVYVESEQKLYVLKTVTPEVWQVVSTSMIEDLKGYIDGSLNNKLNNTTDTFTGTLTIDGSVTYINSINLDISDNIIQINSGMSGTPPSTMVSGMRVNRGNEDPYFFVFSEDDDTFRIGTEATESGLPGNTQAVATREDDPTDFGIPYWNETEDRFDTSAGFTFSGDNKFTLGNFNLTDNAGTIVMSRGAGAFLQATTSSTSLTAPGQTTSGFFASSAISRISNSQIALGNTATFNTFVTISNLAGLNTLIDVKGYGGSATSVFKIQKNGEIYCPSIGDAYQSKVLYYNETTGRITSGDASFGEDLTIEGSTNVIPVFNSTEDNIENSNFKITTNTITKADGTGNLVIESGETNGDLHLKTYANANADFYLDPRDGTIIIGKDHSILNAILRVGGLGANGNFTLEPKGTGRMVLKGGLELSNISEAKRNQILYYNTTDQTVTYGDGNIGTANYVPKFNSAGDGIEDSSAYFTGDTLFVKDLQIDNSLFTKSGTSSSVSGTDLRIKAGDSYTTAGSGGKVIISGGDNLTNIQGPGGEVYIGPGKQYSEGGQYVARVYIGTPEYNSGAIALTPAGTNSNISLNVESKGVGMLYLGKTTANTYLTGGNISFTGNGAGSFNYSSSGQYLRFNTDHSIIGLDGNVSSTPSSITLKAGDSSIGGGLGGNLTLGPGEGRSGGVDGSLYIINIPIDVSANKVLYYNSTTNEVTAGDAPDGGGTDISLGTSGQIPFMNSSSDGFEYDASLTWDGKTLNISTKGGGNLFIGPSAGAINSAGNLNMFIGRDTGALNTSGYNNHFIGYQAGRINSGGYFNHFYGLQAGFNNTFGDYNQFYGCQAGYTNSTGNNNHFYGYEAGRRNSTGNNNHFYGYKAGYSNANGSNNYASGYQAGYLNMNGSLNMFIGYQAGYNELGSNKLYIENSNADASNALIYGEFDGDKLLRINASSFELPLISEASTNKVLFFDTSDGRITYGDAPSGGGITIEGSTNYIPVFNATNDNIENSHLSFSIDALNRGVLKNEAYEDFVISAFSGEGHPTIATGRTIIIKGGDTSTAGGSEGNVIIRGGDNNTSINGPGGVVYISPGKQYASSGNYAGLVYLGDSQFNSTLMYLRTEGIETDINLAIEPKGAGTMRIGKTVSPSQLSLFGSPVQVGTNSNYWLFNTTSNTLSFPLSNNDGILEGGWGLNQSKGYDLTVRGGKAHSNNAAQYGDGGDLYLIGGAADASEASVAGGNIYIQGGAGKNGGQDGSIYFTNLSDASANKIIFFNPDTSAISYGDVPSGGGGMDVSLGTVDQIPFMKSSSNFEYSDNFKYDGTRLIALVDGALAVAIGSNSTTSTSGVAIGHAASATNGQSTAVGPSANSSGNRSTALGVSSTSRASSTIAIGDSADAANNYSIAIGSSSVSSASNSIAIGTSSKSSHQYNISIGDRAGNSSGTVNANAISIGRNANDGADDIGLNSVALGVITVASGQSAIAIGEGAESVASYMIAIGNDAGDTAGTIGTNSISLGYGANAGTFGQNRKIGQNSIGVGTGSKSPGTGSIGIGLYCDASADYSVSLSPYAYSYGVGSMALGRYSIANAQGAIIMGYHTLAQTNDLSDSFKLMWDGVTGFHTGKTLGTQIMVSDNPETILTDASNGSLVYDSSYHRFMSYEDDEWVPMNGGWKYDTSNNLIKIADPSDNLQLGVISLEEDGGPLTAMDMSVSSSPGPGTEESYSFDLDGSTVMKVYGTATGSGGLQETALVVEADYQYMGSPTANGSWRFYVAADSSLVFERRIGGSWVQKGAFAG